MQLARREAMLGSMLAVSAVTAWPTTTWADDLSARLSALERTHGGRLGVSAVALESGRQIGHRADERFLMCSTFKTLAAAYVLARVDARAERLDRRVTIAESDLVMLSPVTETRVGKVGMTVAELCEAMVTRSDNAAANLLLADFGGPAALTGYLRTLGDQVSRLDRNEPALNEHDYPGDLRDTTTPATMLATLRTLLFGDALSRSSRDQLTAWLIANKTGGARLRAGFPQDGLAGEKTGSGSTITNDAGFVCMRDRGPILVAAYCEMPSASSRDRDAVLADVGRIVAEL